MLGGLFGRKRNQDDGDTGPGHPIYAVGDVHGRLDLLKALMARIRDDAGDGPAELIYLGDYVDRGPESCGVIDALLGTAARTGYRCTFLKGNHEATLLDFLGDASLGPAWARFGGRETLASYGVRIASAGADWERVRRDFELALPLAHRRFLEGLELFAERGRYFFVHAGIDPDLPLLAQGEEEYLWIRSPFLDSTRALEKIVVHGHTPESEPVHNARRIGVDTGAYASGCLTAARIEGRSVRFIAARLG